MLDPLSPFLRDQGFVVLDGGLATELEKRGADIDDPLWSAKLLIEEPETIERLHYDYFVAGADVGTSASYQATFEGFARRGIEHEEARKLLRLSVELVARARDRFWAAPEHREGRLPPLIAASVGCYGAFLHDGSEYRGHYGLTAEALASFHEERLKVLARAGADLLACETIPCALEARVLVSLLEDPSFIAFSCRDGRSLSSGESFAEAARAAASAPKVLAVGVNCTPPGFAESLLRSASTNSTQKPLVSYPNSGELWDAPSATWRPAPHGIAATAANASLVTKWYDAGARLIGGCCRTGPETIREVRRALTEHVVPKNAPDGP